MPFRWDPKEQFNLSIYVSKWFMIAIPVAVTIGSICAFFLWFLDLATNFRIAHPWIIFFLPIAGVFTILLYQRFGKSVEGGNNLIIDQIHEPGAGVPSRMTPLILISTIVTHLFGGSAGREGTAVQMGGSIASMFTKRLKLNTQDRRTLLMMGVAGGFGAVFGTPLTGAVFAMEVLAIGGMKYDTIMPCLMTSVLANWTCLAWGIRHTQYHIGTFSELTFSFDTVYMEGLLILKVAIAGAVFGLVSVFFAELGHSLTRIFHRLISWALLRPVIGGLIVISLTYLIGTQDYLGLGISSNNPESVTILSCFNPGGASVWSWWWKILFTVVTLSSGFKGGEVTPMFFIGAALGNTLSIFLNGPTALFAGLGFLSIFAGATNTPLACTIMGIELFGPGNLIYIALSCFMAYLFSGHSGIYLSQRISTPKAASLPLPEDASLHKVRESRHPFWKRIFEQK